MDVGRLSRSLWLRVIAAPSAAACRERVRRRVWVGTRCPPTGVVAWLVRMAGVACALREAWECWEYREYCEKGGRQEAGAAALVIRSELACGGGGVRLCGML